MLGSEGRIPQRGSGDKRIELASKDWPEGGAAISQSVCLRWWTGGYGHLPARARSGEARLPIGGR